MKYRVLAVLLVAAAAVLSAADSPSPLSSGGLYPNDAGPAAIDVSSYPKEMQQNYKLFASRCNACHTIARPINSQFLELSAEEQTAAREKESDLFKDDKIWKVEDHVWNRYVKRMMAKPGCPVQGPIGKRIWEFLVYDSKIRKMGSNRDAWRSHRQKLLDDFKRDHAEDYQRIFSN